MDSKWEIQDENGTLYSGDNDEMMFIWNCITKDLLELYDLYPDKLRGELQHEKVAYQTEWSGDLKLVKIYAVYR